MDGGVHLKNPSCNEMSAEGIARHQKQKEPWIMNTYES